ncbi:hypothetical protein PHLCEN_2v13433 [Hermanssonia centrifuga]|uniref:Uncharacterized protein n=1 Tax=Hermanssonia centrifuga TaxID=98765 RepID=A0A2R6NEB1_9APHY|nr:hypothetical protein PHLCEN_2v13433 [Hermanssonia centrifuga]
MVLKYLTPLFAALIVSSTSATAIPAFDLQGREAFAPVVVTPNASTFWIIGTLASVSWDASTVPSDADPLPWLALYNTSSFGSAIYITTLASDFDAHAGSVEFTVPDVDIGSYFVMMAAWGQDSPHFRIRGSNFIISPDADTVWTIGQEASVIWDPTAVASEGPEFFWVDLYNTTIYGGANDVMTLASNFDTSAGSITFIVPEVSPGSYFIMREWGQSTTHFEIVA